VQQQRDIETIFDALDIDHRGTISLEEFVQLRQVADVRFGTEELGEIFTRKDADGSGALDVAEFTSLVHEFGLLQCRDAIVSQAKAARSGKAEERTKKEELWKLGMPKKRAMESGSAERPSLAGLCRNLTNARKMLQPAGEAAHAIHY